MKRKFINIGLAASLLFASACGKDFLDVNTDPNNPNSAPAKLVFPAAVISTASVVGGDFAIVGGFWSQHWTQGNSSNQYKDIDAFSLQSSAFQNRWTELYAGALNDYKYVKEQAEATGDPNLKLMATVMEAYTYQVLTDLYGDIPFTEALLGATNLSPAFDPGEKVYDGIITRLDEAINNATSEPNPIGDNDIVFHGDMEHWLEFANTLKLKIYLRQTEARPGVAQSGVTSLYSDPQFLATNAHVDIFTNSTGKSNPLYEQDQRILNTKENIRASNTLFTFLDDNGDPRIEELYSEGDGGLKGMDQGTFTATSVELAPASVSKAIISPTAPVYFISEAESYFLQAEAIVRGWGTGNAKTLYDNGVRASFRQLGFVNADAAPFIAAGGPYAFPASNANNAQIEAIITQKWVSMAGTTQGLESFFERNRTGFPRTSTVPRTNQAGYVPGQFIYPVEGVTGLGNFARRLLIPENELQRNPNAAGALKPITTKIWWAKETL